MTEKLVSDVPVKALPSVYKYNIIISIIVNVWLGFTSNPTQLKNVFQIYYVVQIPSHCLNVK